MITIFVDGGSKEHGTANRAYGSALIKYPGNDHICRWTFGTATNNQAEYLALINVLEILINNGTFNNQIKINMDSQLVVNQVNGEFRVKNSELRRLYTKTKDRIGALALRGNKVRISWISRTVIEPILGH